MEKNNYVEKLDLVFGENFIKLSRPMIKLFGLKAAVMLCDLYAEYQYWLNSGKVNSYGYFFSTIENVSDNTGLSAHEQREAIHVLEEYGIIKSHLHGLPAKRYFKIEEECVNKLYFDLSKYGKFKDKSNSIGEVKEKSNSLSERPDDFYKKHKVARSLSDIDLSHPF